MNTQQTLYALIAAMLFLACSDNGLESGTPIRMFTNADAGGQSTTLDGPMSESPRDIGTATVDAGMIRDARWEADAAQTVMDAEAPPPMPDMGLMPDPEVNRGWIGGPCGGDGHCDYEQAFCLTDEDGYPRGMCSLDCERFCPDLDGMPVTFCIGDVVAGGGACVQRCDYNAFGGTGCRPGYRCETRPRFNEMEVGRGVCVPGDAPVMGPGTGGCFEELNARGVNYQRAAPISDAVDDAPHLMCLIDETVRLESPVNGVTFQYLDNEPASMTMTCDLAVALHKLGQLICFESCCHACMSVPYVMKHFRISSTGLSASFEDDFIVFFHLMRPHAHTAT